MHWPHRCRPEGRQLGDETGRRWPTTTGHQPAPSSRRLCQDAHKAIQELGPPAGMLVGITLLFCVGPVAQFMTALGHSKTSLLVAHGCQRELDEHRIAGHWFLPAGIVPAEREASRWIYGLHDDGAALVPELHIAMSARFDDEVDPVSEPLAHLVGLSDGSPHQVH